MIAVRLLAASGLALALAACSNIGVAPAAISGPGASSVGSSTNTTTGTGSVPSSATQSVATSVVNFMAGSPVGLGATQLPASSGVTSAALTLPFSGNVNLVASAMQPGDIGTFSTARAVTSALRSTLSTVPNATAMLFLEGQPAATTAGGSYTLSFVLAGAPSGTQYGLGYYDGTNWYPSATGSYGTITGNTVIFNGVLPDGFALNAGTTYALVLYSVPPATSTTGQ